MISQVDFFWKNQGNETQNFLIKSSRNNDSPFVKHQNVFSKELSLTAEKIKVVENDKNSNFVTFGQIDLQLESILIMLVD